MTEPLQHDPRTKQQVKDMLYDQLYLPVRREFQTRLETLILQNMQLGGYTHRSFLYRGTLYNCDSSSPPRRSNRLVPQLTQQMNDYLRDLKKLNEQEIPYVVGYINQVLNASNDFHDWLRLLPESLHAPLHKLIASCPCRTQHLPKSTIENIQQKNEASLQLMKKRMTINLLTK